MIKITSKDLTPGLNITARETRPFPELPTPKWILAEIEIRGTAPLMINPWRRLHCGCCVIKGDTMK